MVLKLKLWESRSLPGLQNSVFSGDKLHLVTWSAVRLRFCSGFEQLLRLAVGGFLRLFAPPYLHVEEYRGVEQPGSSSGS
jgi:hypothetical protein